MDEQLKEIALRVAEGSPLRSKHIWLSDQQIFDLFGSFLAALPKPEPFAWTTKGQIAAMENGFQHYIQGRVPRFVQPSDDDIPLYTSPPATPAPPPTPDKVAGLVEALETARHYIISMMRHIISTASTNSGLIGCDVLQKVESALSAVKGQ